MTDGPSAALLIPSLRGGGAERVMVTLANAFARRGVRVDLLVCRAVGPYADEVDAAVRVIDLGHRRVSRCLLPLARYLRRERPTVLLATMMHVNAIASLARLLAGTRRVTRLVVREALPIARELASSRAMRAVVPHAYRRCDDVIFVSDCQRERFERYLPLPSRIGRHVIVNPADGAALRARAAAGPAPSWAAAGPYVLGMGRLTRQKDFSTLIEAYARVRAAHACRLVILGEGEERGALERRVAELGLGADVELPGFLPNPFPALASAAVFVLSSRWEGMPNALVQAVALGTPAVATDCECGPSEVLDGGRIGALVPVGDVAAMAEAIAGGLDAGRLGGPPPRWAHAFSVEHAVERYLEVCGLAGAAAGADGERP